MNLPSISVPYFITTIPSTKEEIHFRPFLVKEEKILLMALTGEDEASMNDAIENILNVCIREDIDIKKLSYYDIEYLFLKIRSKSVGEIIELNLKTHSCVETCKPIEYKLNIDEVNVKFNDDHTNKIMITDEIGVMLKYPDYRKLQEIGKKFADNNIETIFQVVIDCIDCIFDQETVYDQASKKELNEFLEGLNSQQFQKLIKFFQTMPKLSHTLKYKCNTCGTDDELLLEGLKSFFL